MSWTRGNQHNNRDAQQVASGPCRVSFLIVKVDQLPITRQECAMVFIVKIPGRLKESSSPDDPTSPGAMSLDPALRQSHEMAQTRHIQDQNIPSDAGERSQDVSDALDALNKLSVADPLAPPSGFTHLHDEGPQSPLGARTNEDVQAMPSTDEPSTHRVSPMLDVIVAPAVLAHRYVRGTDISLIVERPERVRAVLLGVSALLGRLGAEEDLPPAAAERSRNTDADSLAAQMAHMSVDNPQLPQEPVPSEALPPPIQVLHSVRSIPLHPPHPALAAVHSHEEEIVESLLPEYEERRRARHSKSPSQEASSTGEQQPNAPVSEQPYSDLLSQLCSYAPHSAPVIAPRQPTMHTRNAVSATNTPTGRTRSVTARDLQATASADTSPVKYKQEGQATSSGPHSGFAAFANLEPKTPMNEAPGFSVDVAASALTATGGGSLDPSGSHVPDTQGSSTSDDDEGDLHPSEVPRNMNQGDLYLRGTRKLAAGQTSDPSYYGSAEAIQHALGASIEAIDRVVSGARLQHSQPGPSAGLPSSSYVTPLVFNDSRGGRTHIPGPARRAFVLTRPPGHHCSGSVPSGFCWVNNAVVAAMHAYQAHGIDRVAIFDIDLHHGNGTQKLVWRINADTRRTDIEREARLHAIRSTFAAKSRGGSRNKGPRKSAEGSAASAPPLTLEQEESKVPPRGLQVFYGSLHDIESFPCEDGDADLVRDASTCIEGAHGQWIWNTHLDTYSSEDEFISLYERKYSHLFAKARSFLARTGATPERTLMLISCGFDACSYEMPGMQRHGKNVPPGFYYRFARDTATLAEELSEGKCVSLLEGGYGDRALCSASIAHLKGLSEDVAAEAFKETHGGAQSQIQGRPAAKQSLSAACIDPYGHPWWSSESLKALEKVMAKRLASHSASQGLQSATSSPSVARKKAGASMASSVNEPAWLKAASQHFGTFEDLCEPLMRGFGPKVTGGRRR